MSSEEQEKIECPGSFLKHETYMFEQIAEGKFVFWDKKLNKKLEDIPLHDFVVMDDCPWKLAKNIEDYESEDKLWYEIKTFLLDHVFLPDERLYDVLTAWVKATWVPEKWSVIPYLLIKGPMSSGKTRLLETLEAISYRGIFSSNMTCSALFRSLELFRPTLFLDEVEIYRKEEYSEVSHLLNAGYRRGQKAWRVEHRQDGTMCIKGYDVFGMKAMAGTEELVGTLQSRSIIVDMVKNIQRVNFRVNEKRAEALRNRLLLWRFRQLSTFCEDCEDSEDPDGTYLKLAILQDGRLMELFFCLLKVSNLGTENILDYAKSMKEVRESEEQTTYQYQTLDAMLKCKDDVIDGKILAKTVRDKMNVGLDEREKFSTKFVLRLLSDLGFKKTHLRDGNGVLWNEKMLTYRLKQYRIGQYNLSLSNDNKQCYFCKQPIIDDKYTSDKITMNQPAHLSCFEIISHLNKETIERFEKIAKAGGKCAYCGISDIRVLHIHHKPDKSTIVLCANCHMLEHSYMKNLKNDYPQESFFTPPPASSLSSQSSQNGETPSVNGEQKNIGELVSSQKDRSIVSLVRLTSHFEDKCFKCGVFGTMDYQANFTDGSWGLLCEKCGKEMEEKIKSV